MSLLLQPALFTTTLMLWLLIVLGASAFILGGFGVLMAYQRRVTTDNYNGEDRRMNGNGRSWTSLDSWARAIGLIGIPGAALFFILYYAVPEMPKMVRAMEAVALETRFNRERMDEQITLSKRLIVVTIRACRAAARTDQVKEGCDAD